MLALTLRSLSLCLAVLLVSPLAAAAEPWRWPLEDHRLVSRFDFKRADPYRHGARRGVTFAAATGARVVSVCAGVVSFAGLLPDGRRGVTIRCGALSATELGLSSVEVERGQPVVAGQPLGLLTASRQLSVGARTTSERDGYRDPLGLFSSPPPAGTLAPLGRRTARPPRAARRAAEHRGGQRQPVTLWLLGAVWLGLGISGAALGAGITLRGRRDRRERPLATIAESQRQH